MGPDFDLRVLRAQQQINDALGVRPQPQQQVPQARPMVPQPMQPPNLQAVMALLQQRQAQPNSLAALMARYQQRPQ